MMTPTTIYPKLAIFCLNTFMLALGFIFLASVSGVSCSIAWVVATGGFEFALSAYYLGALCSSIMLLTITAISRIWALRRVSAGKYFLPKRQKITKNQPTCLPNVEIGQYAR